MRALVQHRVHRRIEPGENLRADQARLALAPVGAGNDFLGRHQVQCQTVAIQEHFETQSIDGVEQAAANGADATSSS